MCPIAGGNWNNASDAGVWALNLNNSRSNSNTNVGFRADSETPRTPDGDGGAKGGVFLQGYPAKSVCFGHSGRASGLEGLAA